MTEKVLISTCKYEGKYFAVGISSKNGKIIRITLPKKSEEEAIEEITNIYQDYVINNENQNIAREIAVIYSGKQSDVTIDHLELSTGKYSPFKSEFMRDVLMETCKIPCGSVESYKSLAKKMNTHAYRAVGTALAKNPYPLVIPCHRVVRSDHLIGKFGGGSEMKKELLVKEGVKIRGNKVVEK